LGRKEPEFEGKDLTIMWLELFGWHAATKRRLEDSLAYGLLKGRGDPHSSKIQLLMSQPNRELGTSASLQRKTGKQHLFQLRVRGRGTREKKSDRPKRGRGLVHSIHVLGGSAQD